ncbi:TetR/AcrR family transcriptional regulator [Marinobacterium arenosum]|uniref:TetR/AcrR family transcriptional regulator n=1 Tax=Marinobacterium arenosum TaxID=2862496 RepID=UPI001C969FAE|nr:TetR/AcrR family transcriptional regulator [Marinobacterium arenosum]MBY4676298.1 TetR/AcrR family transcriptional regulator [Marinobacterium arenosum]
MTLNGNASRTRGQILEAAADIISDQGISALTAASLIEQAGISKGGLYHHFKQMDEVMLATLTMLVDRYLELLDDGQDRNVMEVLDRLERNLFEVQLSQRRLLRALYCFAEVVMFRSAYRQQMVRLFDGIRQLRRQQLQAARPDLSDIQLQQLSALLDIHVQGVLSRHQLDDEAMVADERAHWQAFRELFLQALPPVALVAEPPVELTA